MEDIRTRKNYMNYKELEKYTNNLQDHMYKCKCSHTVLVGKNYRYSICNWCGRKVYKNAKDEFIDRMEIKLYGRKNRRTV